MGDHKSGIIIDFDVESGVVTARSGWIGFSYPRTPAPERQDLVEHATKAARALLNADPGDLLRSYSNGIYTFTHANRTVVDIQRV